MHNAAAVHNTNKTNGSLGKNKQKKKKKRKNYAVGHQIQTFSLKTYFNKTKLRSKTEKITTPN